VNPELWGLAVANAKEFLRSLYFFTLCSCHVIISLASLLKAVYMIPQDLLCILQNTFEAVVQHRSPNITHLDAFKIKRLSSAAWKLVSAPIAVIFTQVSIEVQ